MIDLNLDSPRTLKNRGKLARGELSPQMPDPIQGGIHHLAGRKLAAVIASKILKGERLGLDGFARILRIDGEASEADRAVCDAAREIIDTDRGNMKRRLTEAGLYPGLSE